MISCFQLKHCVKCFTNLFKKFYVEKDDCWTKNGSISWTGLGIGWPVKLNWLKGVKFFSLFQNAYSTPVKVEPQLVEVKPQLVEDWLRGSQRAIKVQQSFAMH